MQHVAADDFDGGRALLEEFVMELLERESGALLLFHVSAELENLQLAEVVVEVEGIRSAAFGFHEADAAGLVALIDEEVYGLVKGYLASVELDGDDEAGVAEESILQLA